MNLIIQYYFMKYINIDPSAILFCNYGDGIGYVNMKYHCVLDGHNG